VGAAIGLLAKGPVLALVCIGDVEMGMRVGLECIEALVVVISSKRGELEGGEVRSSVECFVERTAVGRLCQDGEGSGGSVATAKAA
jgi:hypothetical protein